jgi:hypothetical protein
MQKLKSFAILCLCFSLSAQLAKCQTIALWDFGTTTTGTAPGPIAASTGTGTATLLGSNTATFATGVTGAGWNLTAFPAQGTNSGTGGAQFSASTAGTAGAISLQFDLRMSGTMSRYFQLQATSDGTTFSNVSGGTTQSSLTLNNNVQASMNDTGSILVQAASGSQQFVQGFSYTFAAGSAFENNPNFAFRLVSVFDPTGNNGSNYISSNLGTTAAYSTAGTFRIDNVSIAVVPEPATMIGFSLIGLGFAAYGKKKLAKASK